MYTDEEKTLNDVKLALKGICEEIDQNKHLSYHKALHSGTGYGEDNDYLHKHDQKYPHKHYTLASDDIDEVILKLASFIK